ncbi:MAG TPA: fibronectin type III domain-containing protein [Nitrolancea sp.]|nr:fibronectin type III domain-containing protein [Nitrolancea sp.]
MLKKAALALLVLTAISCGKRGDPKPPVPMIPQTTSDLVVTQRGSRIVLAWSYPALTTAGKKLGSIRRVVVYRYVEPLTVTQGQPLADFSTVPQLTPNQFNKLKTKIDSIEGARLPASTDGAKLTYEDTPEFQTADKRPVRLTYSVVTEGTTASGALSNLAIIVPIAPPSVPTGFTASAKPEGVVLAWQKPASGTVSGYNVYRTPAGQSFDELSAPANPTPVAQTTFTDVPPYGTYDYRVSAVASAGPPRIESELTEPASATFKDLLPPPPPTGLTALLETKAVRLVWDPVDVPDLNGYFVYRIEGTVRLQLTPIIIPQTSFRDISIQPGVEYTYEVVAIDRANNVSAPAKTAPVLVPRTP